MRITHWKKASPARRGVVLLATLLTVASALALSTVTTAGAVGLFGPHAADGSSASGTKSVGHADPSSTVAPLSQANIVVTDLATGNATVYEYSNPAPIYPTDVNCNTGTTDMLCLNYGDGPGPDGGAFEMVPPGALAAGQDFSATMSASAGGTTCGSGTFSGSAGASATGVVEVDQYVFTPGPSPVKTVAVQFDCTNDSVDISGTIAYDIVPTNPGNGYYVFGQAGELAGFGNDNYLDYLDGATYYNLNAPIVGDGAHTGRWRLLDGRLRRRGVRQRRCAVLRLDGQSAPEQARGRHGGHARRQGVLVRGVRRRDLRLRRRPVLRLDREPAPEQADRRHGGDAVWSRLLAGGVRRRDLRLRRRPVLRLDREPAPEQARGRHGADARRAWLLVRGVRRRDLRLRRRRSSTVRPGACSSTSPSSA